MKKAPKDLKNGLAILAWFDKHPTGMIVGEADGAFTLMKDGKIKRHKNSGAIFFVE